MHRGTDASRHSGGERIARARLLLLALLVTLRSAAALPVTAVLANARLDLEALDLFGKATGQISGLRLLDLVAARQHRDALKLAFDALENLRLQATSRRPELGLAAHLAPQNTLERLQAFGDLAFIEQAHDTVQRLEVVLESGPSQTLLDRKSVV